MRSAFTLAAFAAAALAVPMADSKRGLEYEYEIAYVTNVVTVTEFGPKPTDPVKKPHYGHHNNPQPAPVAPVYTAPAPAPVPVAPVVPAEAPSYGGSSSVSGDAPTDYKSAVVFSHNQVRKFHGVPDVEWDEELYECAKTIALSCVYEHDTETMGGGYGQNIAAGVEESKIGEVIIDMFYNGEEPLYTPFYGREPDMTNFPEWGHFTQLVWKGTTHVACYTADCSATGLGKTGGGVSPHFTVCNYKSPGNYAGQYGDNVLARLGGSISGSAASY